MRGAGGTSGGVGRFFIGFTMLCVGGYLLLTAIQVNNAWGLSMGMFRMGGVSVTSGMVLVPFIFGIGIVFYNARNPIGWILAIGSLVLLTFGIITSVQMRLRPMNLFELITIIVLLVGGLGLFLNSLKNFSSQDAAT